MSVRLDAMRAYPDFPWLDATDLPGLVAFLRARGWLAEDETVVACAPAGDGNMNLTLRVRTDHRSLIVKQARPWVEKYDHIAAPWERGLSERRFYERVVGVPRVAGHLPRLLASDEAARVLLLEDLAGARDLTGLYTGGRLEPDEVVELAQVLRALHDATARDPSEPDFNRPMRELNHAHCFVIPFDPANGVALDTVEPGLQAGAAALVADHRVRAVSEEIGARYRDAGGPLLHGDYFPGSWLRTAHGLRVIDPEFCFRGVREIDVGCAVAHLALARQAPALAGRLLAAYEGSTRTCEESVVARYAGAEIVRRLIGVAQLPIPPTHGWRAALLDAAARALVTGTLDPLWRIPDRPG